MAIRAIVKKGEEILGIRCHRITQFDARLHRLLDDMADTMRSVDGAGIAAPQVGIARRVFIVDTGGKIIECINPEILSREGEQREAEGCLSVPGVFGYVVRPTRVTLRALDRYGNPFEITGEGSTARAFDHENDHLDGHLFTEKVYKYCREEEDGERRSSRRRNT